MAFLLNLILFFLVVVFVAIGVTAWRVYSSFRNVADRLRGRQNAGANGNRQRQTYNNTATDEVIIDRRTPDEANRKIFQKNEGEYVDFVEE